MKTSTQMKRSRVTMFAPLLVAGLAIPFTQASELPTQLVVFGDAYSDSGNAFRFSLDDTSGDEYPVSPPYFDGRFTNGPVWVDVLAAELRAAPPEPSLSGGTNYAWGGAGVAPSENVPSLSEQVDSFMTSAIVPSDRRLLIVLAGAADFDRCDFAETVDVPDPSDLVAQLSEQITRLAGSGAPLMVGNLPPMGRTPRAHWLGEHVDPAIPALFDRLSSRFNALLALELRVLEIRLGVEIIALDLYALTERILATPEEYGFTSVSSTARRGENERGGPVGATTSAGTVAQNVKEHLFFDDVHFTSAWHELLAGEAFDLLAPEDAEFTQ